MTSVAGTEALVPFLLIETFDRPVALAPLRRSSAAACNEDVDDRKQEDEGTARDDDEPQIGAGHCSSLPRSKVPLQQRGCCRFPR
jgi:hypothetical protein